MSASLRLILVRHGETDWNKERRVQGGESDIELNETGLEQARKLASYLQDENIIAILASPLRRATATADAIASHHQLPVEVNQDLREIGVGSLEGICLSDLDTTFSQFLKRRWEEGGTAQSARGETFVDLQHRVWKVVQELLARALAVTANRVHKDGAAVVLVSHFFVVLAIVLRALELPVDSFTRFRVDLGGISTLEFSDHGTRLLTFNDTSF